MDFNRARPEQSARRPSDSLLQRRAHFALARVARAKRALPNRAHFRRRALRCAKCSPPNAVTLCIRSPSSSTNIRRVTSASASFIPDQTIEEHKPDKTGGLTLQFPASGLNEIARWVMGYGRHAKVLAPPELREIVVAHIRELSESYNAEDGN